MNTITDSTASNRASELDKLANIIKGASDRLADDLRDYYDGEPGIHPDPIVGCRIVHAWAGPTALDLLAERVLTGPHSTKQAATPAESTNSTPASNSAWL